MTKPIIVIKLGSSVVVTPDQHVDTAHLSHVLDQVREVQKSGVSIVLIISGALVCGMGALGIEKPEDDVRKHTLAGIGQAHLIHALCDIAEQKHMRISQILLKRECIDDEVKRTIIRDVILDTVSLDIVPILNENDAVSLNNFGGNDFVAEEVAKLLGAKEVVVLSNVHGLMDLSNGDDPHDRATHIIPEVAPDVDLDRYISTARSQNGVGGMVSKLEAVQDLQKHRIPSTIVHGREPNVLVRLLIDKEKIGTRFIV